MGVIQVIPTLRGTSGGGGGGGGTGGGAGTTYPWTSGIKGYGDSITNSPSPVWFEAVNTFKGTTGSRFPFPGLGVSAVINHLYTNAPLTQSVPLATFIGFNDTRVLSGQAARYEHVKAGHRAIAALQFRNSCEQFYSGNSDVTFSSGPSDADSSHITGWGSQAQWFIANGTPGASFYYTASSVLNATVSFSITGTSLVIGTWGFSSVHPASRIEVKIDGVVVTTYDPNNRSYEPAAIVNDAIVITGLSSGTHSVVLKFLDGGVLTALDWFGTLKTPAACSTIPLYVLDLIHLIDGVSGEGYDFSGFQTTQAILDGCTAARKTDLQTVFSGYPICFIDINTTYTANGTNTQSDGIHPTVAGQALIANRVEFYLS